MQRFEFWVYGRNAIQTIEIELHCRGPAFHDHLLKNPGGPVLALTRIERLALRNRNGGSRVGWDEENDERENEGSEGFLKHCFER